MYYFYIYYFYSNVYYYFIYIYILPYFYISSLIIQKNISSSGLMTSVYKERRRGEKEKNGLN